MAFAAMMFLKNQRTETPPEVCALLILHDVGEASEVVEIARVVVFPQHHEPVAAVHEFTRDTGALGNVLCNFRRECFSVVAGIVAVGTQMLLEVGQIAVRMLIGIEQTCNAFVPVGFGKSGVREIEPKSWIVLQYASPVIGRTLFRVEIVLDGTRAVDGLQEIIAAAKIRGPGMRHDRNVSSLAEERVEFL